jgi:hypothetical protein
MDGYKTLPVNPFFIQFVLNLLQIFFPPLLNKSHLSASFGWQGPVSQPPLLV